MKVKKPSLRPLVVLRNSDALRKLFLSQLESFKVIWRGKSERKSCILSKFGDKFIFNFGTYPAGVFALLTVNSSITLIDEPTSRSSTNKASFRVNSSLFALFTKGTRAGWVEPHLPRRMNN